MGLVSRQRTPTLQVRDALLRAARELLDERGPDALVVRDIAARLSRPEASSPWPSWTDFEKLSTTWKPLPFGWAISMRQLFVPRSSAA